MPLNIGISTVLAVHTVGSARHIDRMDRIGLVIRVWLLGGPKGLNTAMVADTRNFLYRLQLRLPFFGL